MAIRNYSVQVLSGKNQITKVLMAESAEQARSRASQDGLVLSVKKIRSTSSFDKMSMPDRLVFFQRLASMISARVGASEALNIIQTSFTGTVRDAAAILREQLQSGANLAQAMEKAGPRFFPPAIVAIVRTGSQGGDMAYALKEAARYEREMNTVKSESSKGLWSALSGFGIGVITIMGSTLYVAPQIMESSLVKMAGDSVDVGWVLSMADAATWAAGFCLLIASCLLVLNFIVRPFSPAMVDRIIMRIPFYRDVVLAKGNYLVLFGLAVLLKAGLRVEEALSLTIQQAPRGELKNDLTRARDAIKLGTAEPWPNKMRMLHPTDRAALSTAQDRTQIANTIEDLADQYQILYRSRLGVFIPAAQLFAAVFLSIAGFILFGVSIIPLMQTTAAILGKF